MERIKGVSPSEAGWITRLIYGQIKKHLRLVPKSKLLAAHHTPGLIATTWMDTIGAAARTVPVTLKVLSSLKVAMMAGCPF